jgi:hypothetical protein
VHIGKDNLKVSQTAVVSVQGPNGAVERYGKFQDVTQRVFRSQEIVPRSPIPEAVRRIWDGFITSGKPPPRSGVGRSGRGRCRKASLASAEAISPLDLLGTSRQLISAGLPSLTIAWSAGSASDGVVVRLSRANGPILAEVSVCGQSFATIPLARGVIRVDDRLTLTATDRRGNTLTWLLEAVPQTAEQEIARYDGAEWASAAAQLVTGPGEGALDALSELEAARRRSYPAWWLFAALLQGEQL